MKNMKKMRKMKIKKKIRKMNDKLSCIHNSSEEQGKGNGKTT